MIQVLIFIIGCVFGYYVKDLYVISNAFIEKYKHKNEEEVHSSPLEVLEEAYVFIDEKKLKHPMIKPLDSSIFFYICERENEFYLSPTIEESVSVSTMKEAIDLIRHYREKKK